MGKFRIIIGDITSNEILDNYDFIVNPINPQMVIGVSGAIFKKVGVDIFEKYTQEYFNIYYISDNYKKENIMNISDVEITSGFNINMDMMFMQGPKQ